MADSWFPSLAGAGAWGGPQDPATVARRVARAREVDARIPFIVREEWANLTAGQPIAEIDPLQDPAGAAAALEGLYGTLEDIPGFYNAGEYAQAGRDYAQSQKRTSAEDAYRQAQFLMPEERYQYMQGPGRLVDLLKGLAQKPAYGRDESNIRDEALTYWDQSNNARTTREDYSNPNYQRFSNPDQGSGALFANPSSPVASALDTMALIPKAILNRSEADSAAQALDQAGQRRGLFKHSVVTPELTVLDIPQEALEGLGPDERREAYFARRNLLGGLHRDIQPPSYQNFTNAVYHKMQDAFGNPYAWGGAPSSGPLGPKANASAGVADTVGMGIDALDPSLAAGATVGIGSKLRAGQSIGKALAGEGIEQAAPEVAFGGGVNAVTGIGGEGSWSDYWLAGKPSDPSKSVERERAAAVTAGLLRESPQDIAAARLSAMPYGQQGSRYRSPTEVYPAAAR